MAVTPASFRALFTEIALTPSDDTRIQSYIDMAARRMNPAAWGLLFDDGNAYLAAHLLVRGRYGLHGPVIGETVGGLSRQYAAGHGLKYGWSDYATTAYGLEFLELCNTIGPTPAVTG